MINSNIAIRVRGMIIRLYQKETRIGVYHNNYEAFFIIFEWGEGIYYSLQMLMLLNELTKI
jgi:hypothetical protein